MLGCDCQQCSGQGDALQMLPRQLEGASGENLMFYVQGVRTGLQIRANEQAKWQRLGVMLAVAFGFLTLMKHLDV